MVCIRSFQLTQKASKMEYKAIESVLQTINPHTGEVGLGFAGFNYHFKKEMVLNRLYGKVVLLGFIRSLELILVSLIVGSVLNFAYL